MTLGKLWADADGQHPNAELSWLGQSFWSTLTTSASGLPAVEGLVQPAPSAVLDLVGLMRYPAYFSAVPMQVGDSAVGLLVLHADGNVVVSVLDLAGRSDLELLEIAAVDCRLYALLVSQSRPGLTPLVPIRGFSELLAETEGLRRLAAREVVDAVAKLRRNLRGPDAASVLMLPEVQRLKSLSITVCQPW